MTIRRKQGRTIKPREPAVLLAATLLAAKPCLAQVALPGVEPAFTGTVGETYAESVPAYPDKPSAPAGAPNILLILTDDVPFGAASTFGGPIPTPNLDRLAARGLIYNRFHTTSACSPTRAALLTGRNHHAVGNGAISDLAAGFPGYLGRLPRSAATVAEVLRQNGYSTAMFGKHHNVPEDEVSPDGPFDRWPTGLGFSYFYGFVGAQTDQFRPTLYRGTTPAPPLDGDVLDKALTDDAIGWLHRQAAVAPDKPFLIYFAPGTAHGPLQAPSSWLARFRERFDQGWDSVRAETVVRQQKIGVIPSGTRDVPRPEGIPAWASLSPDTKRVNARFMEAYAAMLAHQDAQFGRLLDELERMGKGDNTLIIFIEGDNGAAAEAGANGTSNPIGAYVNGMQEDQASLLERLDTIGGPDAIANIGHGWAWALGAPFPWFKQYASHLGGVRNGMVISWPNRVRAHGLRSQFTHVVDVMPTILEAAGVAAPTTVNGSAQQRIDGTSFLYSFDAANASERRITQYFENRGNRAIYHQGWMASTTPVNLPWRRGPTGLLPTDYLWELYDLRRDFSQSTDLAGRFPVKLAQMRAVFHREALANQVYPLDDRLTVERNKADKRTQARTTYEYWGRGVSIPWMNAAPLLSRSFRIVADVELAVGSASGPLVALGSRFGGWLFALEGGRPSALMAASNLPGDLSFVGANAPLAAGRRRITFDFEYDGGRNAGGLMRIAADNVEIASGRISRTILKMPEFTDTLDIGFDSEPTVRSSAASRKVFDGIIHKIEIRVGSAGESGPIR